MAPCRRSYSGCRRLGRALSGLWMAMFYAIVPADSAILHGFRLFFGSAMAVSIVLGYLAIRRRDVNHQQDWMRRTYAIGMGAGTQALTQLPPLLLFGAPDELTLALMMGAAWVANIAVAEWLIRRARVAGTRAVVTQALRACSERSRASATIAAMHTAPSTSRPERQI